MAQELLMVAEWGLKAWNYIGDNAANIIALSAVAVVTYQAWLTRKHNRLSVRPHLQTYIDRQDGEGVFKYELHLRNNGLGPAVIKKWTVYLDGIEQPLPTPKDVQGFFEGLIPKYTNLATRFIGKNDVMRSNDSQALLVIKMLPFDTDKAALEERLERLALVVEYTSMYGENLKPLDLRE